MEYQVPQFIEVENKIVGPLTLRQFIYVAGGVGLCVIFFTYLQFVVAVILSLMAAGFAAALAFYKVNGKPFGAVLEAGFNYYTGAKLLLWKRETQKDIQKNPLPAPETAPRGTPKLTRGKLAELARSLDINSPASEEQNQE
jgi:hypothetical protein